MMTLTRLLTVSSIFALPVTALAADVDPAIPAYKPAGAVTGNLNSIGSDTLNNLMTLWAEAFKSKHAGVNIQIEGKGSATAPPALISGTAQLGPMSREMKQEETDAFEKNFGYKPTEIKVAVDALAVFAHKDNSIKGLTMAQIDALFSSTRKLGAPADISDWGQLGVDAWKGRAISLFGRNSASGTYGFFKEHALGKGDFKSSVKEQPGSSAVVQGVSTDLYALGYSGIGYLTSGVRALPVGESPDKLAEPTYDNCLSGEYPLARFLLLYINKKPGQPLDALTSEFLKFVQSQEGQSIVVKDGYYPLPKAVIDETAAELAK
ncbi:MAG: phosphate ABC transporter substrate-binding protein [Prosthecobacter sp.]|nr:phosphate ABC transporter substrate-binding protein [Prosthecobacter sp.]